MLAKVPFSALPRAMARAPWKNSLAPGKPVMWSELSTDRSIWVVTVCMQ